METIMLPDDIRVLYITATSYPEGILEAHQKLHALIPFSTDRKYFGLSRPEEGGDIVYRAAAEQLAPGEAEKWKCETLIIKKGKYLFTDVKDYLKDLQRVEKAFQNILAQPDLDPQGYCVEWYYNDKDVRCMVRLE